MKHLILILFTLISAVSYAQTETIIYNNGSINNSMINTIDNGQPANITPYTLKYTETIKTKSGESYTVKALRYKGWDEESGDYNVIDISGSKKNIQLKYDDGWSYFFCENENIKNPHKLFYLIDLSNDCIALAFTGVCISDEPPFLTVFVLKNGEPRLVFNKQTCLTDIKTSSNSTILDLRLNIIEYLEDDTPYDDPELAQLIFRDGMIFYKDMSNPEEYDLKEIETRF